MKTHSLASCFVEAVTADCVHKAGLAWHEHDTSLQRSATANSSRRVISPQHNLCASPTPLPTYVWHCLPAFSAVLLGLPYQDPCASLLPSAGAPLTLLLGGAADACSRCALGNGLVMVSTGLLFEHLICPLVKQKVRAHGEQCICTLFTNSQIHKKTVFPGAKQLGEQPNSRRQKIMPQQDGVVLHKFQKTTVCSNHPLRALCSASFSTGLWLHLRESPYLQNRDVAFESQYPKNYSLPPSSLSWQMTAKDMEKNRSVSIICS